jgi:hypothetical protein
VFPNWRHIDVPQLDAITRAASHADPTHDANHRREPDCWQVVIAELIEEPPNAPPVFGVPVAVHREFCSIGHEYRGAATAPVTTHRHLELGDRLGRPIALVGIELDMPRHFVAHVNATCVVSVDG